MTWVSRNRLQDSRWSQDSEGISSNLSCLCLLGPRFWCIFHGRRQQSCRWCFTKPDSASQAAGHFCYSEGKGKHSLTCGWDLYPFSFLPQNLSPVTMLLSQMLPQRRGPMGWSGSALCWSVNTCTRACSSPQGLRIQTPPFPMLTLGLLLKALCGSCSALLIMLRCPRAVAICLAGLATRTSTAQRLTIFQQGCFQRTLLTALIQCNQAHHLNFQSPTEHLINNKCFHPLQCIGS